MIMLKFIAIGIISLTFATGVWGLSNIGRTLLEGIARNPDSADSLRSSALLAMGLIESVVLFAFLSIILLIVLV